MTMLTRLAIAAAATLAVPAFALAPTARPTPMAHATMAPAAHATPRPAATAHSMTTHTTTAAPAMAHAAPAAHATPAAHAAAATHTTTRTTAPAGRMVQARLANGRTVTYNCSLAGNANKQACKQH